MTTRSVDLHVAHHFKISKAATHSSISTMLPFMVTIRHLETVETLKSCTGPPGGIRWRSHFWPRRIKNIAASYSSSSRGKWWLTAAEAFQSLPTWTSGSSGQKELRGTPATTRCRQLLRRRLSSKIVYDVLATTTNGRRQGKRDVIVIDCVMWCWCH